MSDPYDLVIIGGGPGGYVAAIRASQLGLRCALVEREALGGICLNWGCIPSKALLHNASVLNLFRRAGDFGIEYENLHFDYSKAVERSRRVVGRLTKGVEALLKKNRVEVISGTATLRSPRRVEVSPGGQILETERILIATGARPKVVPGWPVDGSQVVTSRVAIEQRDIPPRVIVVGAGAVGMEFAYIYAAYGAQVTILEALPHLLPAEDEEISRALERAFEKRGIAFHTEALVQEIQVIGEEVHVRFANKGHAQELLADRLLAAIGAAGNVEGLGLEALGVAVDRGFIPVNGHLETNIPGLYAIGDVTGPPLLAHVASAQGIAAAEHMAGQRTRPLDYEQMPRATYCQPQVASLGLTEAEARRRHGDVKVGSFPLRASGKALALAEPEGFVKIVAASDGEILGAHLIGPDVTELLGELSLARTLEGAAIDLGRTVHPHPSLSEALMEAALATEGLAIHL